MEAPEKIYVHVKGDKVTNTWNSTWIGVHDVEYIRKNALKQEWKPSEEQLNALHDAAVYVDKSMFPYPKGILMKLYKQLKKLREERQ